MFDEDDFIRRCLRPLAAVPGSAGLTDDAAVIDFPAGESIVVTTDMIVSGVHFPRDEKPALVAARALRVNVSDLVAKGADPLGYLLQISVPAGTGDGFGDDFAAGLSADHTRYGLKLYGGDTAVVPEVAPLGVAVTMFGSTRGERAPRRSGACPGDVVFVSGDIGDAALGLMVARGDPFPDIGAGHLDYLEAAYRLPRPPFGLQGAIRKHARAAMDISDGLVGDLARLCQTSGVSARIRAEKVPLSAAAKAACDSDPRLMKLVLTGGDDYQSMVIVPVDQSISFARDCMTSGFPVKAIGTCGDGPPEVVAIGMDGQPMSFARTRYTHRG
ncbi:MAG: thiamine-phosphate kinase [Rhodobiaceae bacterium]|nr:thiamine-phosphate kinase [Rhodobiaceae bacterium]MCC0016301.1 thiamine-phosphate kinase [Rhodobiaceae bacterium]MCC0041608.1 thiamine-phosphate kinase [Rhodobiaceae bacterium]MCC0052643.1 thiamine-phosphate kinase [Rhodobiaceae bacterium]